MVELEYGFRDEKINIFAMTVGGVGANGDYQTFICKKKMLAPRAYLLDCNKSRSKYRLSSIGTKYYDYIKDDTYVHKFVGIIDEQIRIEVSPLLFQQLSKELFSVWEPSEPLNYFSGLSEGYLVVFRVYEIEHSFRLINKQRMNPLFKLKGNVSVADESHLTIPEWQLRPVLSDQGFKEIKARIKNAIFKTSGPSINTNIDATLSAASKKISYQSILKDVEAEYYEERGPQKEGALKTYFGKRYERSPINRQAAIRIHRLTCNICGFNFEAVYGERGADFIEVHHVKPISSLEEEQHVDPYSDLITVCSNCHRMIHRKSEAILTIEEMKHIVAQQKALRAEV